jgi:AraC-like DNA-binding protein
MRRATRQRPTTTLCAAANSPPASETDLRRLGEAGTTYRELRDAHRRKLAIEFLSDTSLTAAEIAYRLGYEDASNFGKACHRWFVCRAGSANGDG